MYGCPSHPPTGDLACNQGMCPDWESNQRPFVSEFGTQSTEPHQPGHIFPPFKTNVEGLCTVRDYFSH